MVQFDHVAVGFLDDLQRDAARRDLADPGNRLVDFGRGHRLERLALFQHEQARRFVEVRAAAIASSSWAMPAARARANAAPVAGLITSKLSSVAMSLPPMLR